MSSDDDAVRQVRVVIEGRVQGVWYRGWMRENATALGLDGWVRNRRDGTVEAVLSGPSERVERMIGLCRLGPPSARVEDVIVTDLDEPDNFAGFDVKPTA